jgi:hypothetical protein
MQHGSSSLLSAPAGLSDEPEPEPEPAAGSSVAAAFSTDDYFGTGPDGKPVFIGTGGLDGQKATQLEDLTRIGAGGGLRRYRAMRRAAVSAGLDLASQEKGHLEVGEVVEAAEVVVYAGRARVRFPPSAEDRPGGWASVRSGGGRELLRLLTDDSSAPAAPSSKGLWATPRERATQLLCGVHALSEELSVAVLERPVASDGASELSDDEWFEALCAMGSAEVRDLVGLAQLKLEACAAIDAELELAGSALLAGDYATAKQRFASALASCDSATLERRAAERATVASNGLEQAEKGLKLESMSQDDLMRMMTSMDDEDAGRQLGIAEGGGGGSTASSAGTAPLAAAAAAAGAVAGGPQGRPRAPLPPYPGPSRPTASMFSIYWLMPKGEPPPISFEVECVQHSTAERSAALH